MTFEDGIHVFGSGSIPGDVVAFLDNLVNEIGNGVGEGEDILLTIIICAKLEFKFHEI